MANVYRLSLAFLILSVLDLSTAQGDHTYLGCYWDNTVRVLPDLVSCESPCVTVCSNSIPYCQSDNSMTVDFCVDLCKSKYFKYAGLQAGNQCFCGTTDALYSQHGESQLPCAKPCTGNSSQVCGDVYRNSVYDTLYRSSVCPQPDPIANGRIETGEKSEYIQGDSIGYICEGMTFMLGEQNRTCLASGMWDNPSPDCRTVCNEHLPASERNRGTPVPVVEYINSISVEGEQYLLPCLTGYTSTSESLLATCQSDGTWNFNSTYITCEAVVCDTTGLGEGVIVLGNDFTYSSMVTYTCDVGYMSSPGSTTRQCQADGTWSGMDISCNLVSCSPPQIADGVTVSPGPYTYGDVVIYYCVNQDATLIGDSMHNCTADGTWSGQQPICQTADTTTIKAPTTQALTSESITTNSHITTLATTRATTQHPATTRATTQHPATMRATTQHPATTRATTQHPATTRVRTTIQPTTTIQPPTTQSATTSQSMTTHQSATTKQTLTTEQRRTSSQTTSVIYMSSSNEISTPNAFMGTSNGSSSSQSPPSTTDDVINEKAKSGSSPADFMMLIVIAAGVFSVLLLAIIFTVACVKSPKRGKVQVTKSINFISSKETGSMIDILWPDELSPDSPRSRADSGLPPSDRNSPSSNDDSPDGNGAGGVVNLAFENDEVQRRREEDPYHRIDFVAVNESNNISSVLIHSGIMSPPPQTQDDRRPINHSRMNSFQQPDDVDSLYAKVDMSKKSNRSRQNGVERSQSTLSDYKSIENPVYEPSPISPPKLVLQPAEDNDQSKSNGVVRKTSRRTPSDVSVSSPSYWVQYEEQVTRL